MLSLPLSDIISNDLEWLNDEISERITGNPYGLLDIEYRLAHKPVATSYQDVLLWVSGDINSAIL